jgi:hypothetical protein
MAKKAKRNQNNQAGKNRGNKPPVKAVVRKIRQDIVAAAQSVKRRLYKNPHGYTSDEILAAMNAPTAALVTQHLQTSDAAVTALTAVVAAAPAARGGPGTVVTTAPAPAPAPAA